MLPISVWREISPAEWTGCLCEPGARPRCCLCCISDGDSMLRGVPCEGLGMLLPYQHGPVLSVLGSATGFPHLPPSTVSGWSYSGRFLSLVAISTIHKTKVSWAPRSASALGLGFAVGHSTFPCYCLALPPAFHVAVGMLLAPACPLTVPDL